MYTNLEKFVQLSVAWHTGCQNVTEEKCFPIPMMRQMGDYTGISRGRWRVVAAKLKEAIEPDKNSVLANMTSIRYSHVLQQLPCLQLTHYLWQGRSCLQNQKGQGSLASACAQKCEKEGSEQFVRSTAHHAPRQLNRTDYCSSVERQKSGTDFSFASLDLMAQSACLAPGPPLARVFVKVGEP